MRWLSLFLICRLLACLKNIEWLSTAGSMPPEKPKFQRDQSAAVAFNGTVAERHTAADGSAEYVHLVFGSNEYLEGQGGNVVDAEFLFLKGDQAFDWLSCDAMCVVVQGRQVWVCFAYKYCCSSCGLLLLLRLPLRLSSHMCVCRALSQI